MKNEQYEKILKQLSQDFDQLVLDDPDFSRELPPNSYIVFQLALESVNNSKFLEEIDQFNRWVWKVCQPQIEQDQMVIVATLRLLRAETATSKAKPRRVLTPKMLEHLPREFELSSASDLGAH